MENLSSTQNLTQKDLAGATPIQSPLPPEGSFRLDINQIRAFLPHRYPFLLVDRILEIQNPSHSWEFSPQNFIGTKVLALKNFTYNEPYMLGHFPEYTLVPGVLLLESMAQAASFAIYPFMLSTLKQFVEQTRVVLLGLHDASFKRAVIPGDTLRIEAQVTKYKMKIWYFQCQCHVDGQKAAEAEILLRVTAGGPEAHS